jgi:hypothetical protein
MHSALGPARLPPPWARGLWQGAGKIGLLSKSDAQSQFDDLTLTTR